MKINSSLQITWGRIVGARLHAPGMIWAALAASAALFLFSAPSFAQSAAKQKPAAGRESSLPSVSEGVASNPSSSSTAKTTAKSAAPAAASAVPHAPAVAYLLLQSAQGPVNGGSTDAAHRNWIAVSAIDKGSLADGAAKGQASDAMAYKESRMGGVNPLYESKDAMDHKNISDGAAKGQASDAMDHKNIADGAAKGQAQEGVVRDKNISDGAAKSQAVDGMMQNTGAGSGSGNGQSAGVADTKNVADGAAKGQATEGMVRKNNGVSDGAAKGQASEGVAPDKNISDGAAKGQASDATVGFPALDASSKDPAKMAAGAGASSGSHSGSVAVVKETDESSPLLARAVTSGSHFSSAQLDVLDGGVWRHYQLSDVTVSSVQSMGGGTRPSEQIQFTYQKIEMK